MEKNYAIIENGKVVNVAVSETALADNWIQSNTACIGWEYDGTNFIAPPELTPEELLAQERAFMRCSPTQMRLALHRLGLLTQVQAIADSDPEASIVWEYATSIERSSPLIDALGGPNGFTPEQIDDIFRAAMAVEV